MLNVMILRCWETSSKREGEQRKSRVVDSRLSGGNSCLLYTSDAADE